MSMCLFHYNSNDYLNRLQNQLGQYFSVYVAHQFHACRRSPIKYFVEQASDEKKRSTHTQKHLSHSTRNEEMIRSFLLFRFGNWHGVCGANKRNISVVFFLHCGLNSMEHESTIHRSSYTMKMVLLYWRDMCIFIRIISYGLILQYFFFSSSLLWVFVVCTRESPSSIHTLKEPNEKYRIFQNG